ncbi:SH3 domain-binding protein 2 isoform X2 [Polypterus senegalus]|uniref:SH3 domain-binding protein 2 isoform X2 n=1 Tax=Polypterus senegalus TaxID=55291 RepID=UPI00196603C5|nr:SH3 domain-binding protein 2 isoform X2 [Polypterus senegalus]XP_039606791.1 SH3 domain-binding protein 2 isoform X2 [Polypterus senegalus]
MKRITKKEQRMATGETLWPVPMKAIGAQNLLTMPGGVTMSGYLHKKGGTQIQILKWPLRFVIIHKGCAYYFKSSTSASPQGAFSLNGYNRVLRAAEETTSSNVFPFKIVHFSKKHRTWYFSASSEEERKKWMLSLRKEIDCYHERRDSQPACDSSSDSESFYGSVERPIDIKYNPETEDHDYGDEEDEDEDYLTPDKSHDLPRSTVPPPQYPPPPVPLHKQRHLHHEAAALQISSNVPHASSTVIKKESIPVPPSSLPSKGPPPSLPFAPHLLKPPIRLPNKDVSILPEKNSPQVSKFSATTLPASSNFEKKGAMDSKQSSVTLPLTKELEKKLAKNSSEKKPQLPVGPKPAFLMQSTDSEKQDVGHVKKPGLYKPPLIPAKPKLKPPNAGLQRSSPEGQSFRSSTDKSPQEDTYNSSDEDYEKVQLPDSVFFGTTETSEIERIFKENSIRGIPQNGLYCIRNSSTKTTKVLVVWDGSLNKGRNYRIYEKDYQFFLETDKTFHSLIELVEYYHANVLPSHDKLCLKVPFNFNKLR